MTGNHSYCTTNKIFLPSPGQYLRCNNSNLQYLVKYIGTIASTQLLVPFTLPRIKKILLLWYFSLIFDKVNMSLISDTCCFGVHIAPELPPPLCISQVGKGKPLHQLIRGRGLHAAVCRSRAHSDAEVEVGLLVIWLSKSYIHPGFKFWLKWFIGLILTLHRRARWVWEAMTFTVCSGYSHSCLVPVWLKHCQFKIFCFWLL